MLKVFTGDDTFSIRKKVSELESDGNQFVSLEVKDLKFNDFIDTLFAQSLFSTSQNFIVRNLSENKLIWDKIVIYIDKIIADKNLNLVLIEDILDKRTKIVKDLVKAKVITEFKLPKENDIKSGQKFILEYAKSIGLDLSASQANMIFERVGHDRWAQVNAVEKLASLDLNITDDMVDKYIPRVSSVQIFQIFNKIINGEEITPIIEDLIATNTIPQEFFGLIVSQFINALAIKSAPANANIASDLAVNPYAISELSRSIRHKDLNYFTNSIEILNQADEQIKTSGNDIWMIISLALQKLSKNS